MGTQKRRLLKADRDRLLVEAITRARNAMMLLQGTRITSGRKAGFLNFEKEILKLTNALQVLGLDVPSPVLGCDVVPASLRRSAPSTTCRCKPC